MPSVKDLSNYKAGIQRIHENWPHFLKKREERLAATQQGRDVLERGVENIISDLFTEVLGWKISDLNFQLKYADIVVSDRGIFRLVIEAKRPGALIKNQSAIESALAQARRYADEQKVKTIAVCDGMMLYAADIENGGLKDRAYINLASTSAPEILWWLDVHGIYRAHADDSNIAQRKLPSGDNSLVVSADGKTEELLHKKYQLPAKCFAYVDDASNPKNWKLPYRLLDGSVDTSRLPGAIRCVVSNYRGARLNSVPENSIPDILVRLGGAAHSLSCLPYQGGKTNQTYKDLEETLTQLGRLDEVKNTP